MAKMVRKRFGKEIDKYLRALAYNHAIWAPADFEEYLSSAYEGFLSAVRTFDADRASFKTHLYSCVHVAFQRVDRKMWYFVQEVDDYFGDVTFSEVPATDASILFKDMVGGMSDDARAIVNICLSDNLPKLLGMNGCGRSSYMIRSYLKRYLRDKKGWQWKRIIGAFEEISEVLAS